MAEKEACAGIVASVTAELQRERQLQRQQSSDSSSGKHNNSFNSVLTNSNSNSGSNHSNNNSIQGESLLLPLLQGILLHNRQTGAGAGGSSSLSSGNKGQVGGVPPNARRTSAVAASLAIPPVEDSGTESGEDLRLLAAGLHDSIEMYRGIGVGNGTAAPSAGASVSGDGSSVSVCNGKALEHSAGAASGGDSVLKEVTAALQRLQLSLRDGKNMNIDANKRNALLTLVCRLQDGLTQPEKLPERVSPLEEPADEAPDFNQSRRGSQRFAKRRNRNNRHTVGVSREELADARRFIEEISRIEKLSSHSLSPATPEKSKTPEKPQPYSLQKQNSLGAFQNGHSSGMTVGQAAPAAFAMKRPSQFVPNSTPNEPPIRPDRKAKQKIFRQSQSFEQPPTMNGHDGPVASQLKPIDVKSPHAAKQDPFKKPTQTAAQRALVKKYSFNDGSSSDEEAESMQKTAEQVVLRQKETVPGASVSIVNTVQKLIGRETRPQQPQPHSSKSTFGRSRTPDALKTQQDQIRPLNKFTAKKQRMKRANTIDIPKKLAANDDDTDDELDEGRKGKDATTKTSFASTIIKPVVDVPDFKPKTTNDMKFMAFMQKQNQAASKQMWTNPVKEHVGSNNWTSKFDHLKHNFESTDNLTKGLPPKYGAPKNSAMNFWKKAESSSIDDPRVGPTATTASARTSKPIAPVQPKQQLQQMPQQFQQASKAATKPTVPNKLPQSPVTPTKPTPKTPTTPLSPSNQFSHAPTSAFKPIPKKLPIEQLDFKPVHQEPEVVKPIPAKVSCGIVKNIVASGFKETPEVKSEPLNVQIGLVKSLAAAGYHETPYVPPPKIERTPTHHVLNYQAVKPERAESPATPAAPWIGKKPSDSSGSRVASIASTKFTANQFGLNKGSLPAQQPLTYQGSLKYSEKPLLPFQLPERVHEKRPSLPDVSGFKPQPPAESFTYTFTDFTQPESVSTFTLNRSDSLTNPENAPLVLTSTNSIYSPSGVTGGGAIHTEALPIQQQPQLSYLSVSDQNSSASHSPHSIADDDRDELESQDSQEMRAVTRVMRAPVSQQACYSNANKPARLNSASSRSSSGDDRGSLIAQNLQTSLKKIQQKSPTPPSSRVREVSRVIPQQQPLAQQPLQQQYSLPTVEITPQTPTSVPSHVVYNNVQSFSRPAPLTRTDSWTRVGEQPQQRPQPMMNGLSRAKSSHTLAVPPAYDGGYRNVESISDKQRTVEAYFTGQKPAVMNALAKTSSSHNIALRDKSTLVAAHGNMRPVSYAMGHSYNPQQYNIMTNQSQRHGSYQQAEMPQMYSSNRQLYQQHAPQGSMMLQQQQQQQLHQYYQQPPLGGGLARSRTMPHIPIATNLNLLDEENVEDAFEELMSQSFAV